MPWKTILLHAFSLFVETVHNAKVQLPPGIRVPSSGRPDADTSRHLLAAKLNDRRVLPDSASSMFPNILAQHGIYYCA